MIFSYSYPSQWVYQVWIMINGGKNPHLNKIEKMNLKIFDSRYFLSFPGPHEKIKFRRKCQWNVSFWVILAKLVCKSWNAFIWSNWFWGFFCSSQSKRSTDIKMQTSQWLLAWDLPAPRLWEMCCLLLAHSLRQTTAVFSLLQMYLSSRLFFYVNVFSHL